MITTRPLHPLLGRVEYTYPRPSLLRSRCLVTGGTGSIGAELAELLESCGASVQACDERTVDVLDPIALRDAVAGMHYVFHLAAHKHAPIGEQDPSGVSRLNIDGTTNVTDACRLAHVRRVVVASTCKAVEPETVYGASKLVAERIALNARQSVARLFNVVESSGNVFEIWDRQVAAGEEITVVPNAARFFITRREAAGFIAHVATLKPGRYAPLVARRMTLAHMARNYMQSHPAVGQKAIAARKGDRLVEPRFGARETARPVDAGTMRITGWHDS